MKDDRPGTDLDGGQEQDPPQEDKPVCGSTAHMGWRKKRPHGEIGREQKKSQDEEIRVIHGCGYRQNSPIFAMNQGEMERKPQVLRGFGLEPAGV
jgi:hypothetical protein